MNRFKKTFLVLTLFAGIVLTNGCASSSGNFAVLSSQKIDFSKKQVKKEDSVTGTSTKYWIFVIPLGDMRQGTLFDEAARDVTEGGDVDLLKNVTTEYVFWYIPFIFGKSHYSVTGEAWAVEE